MTQIATNTTENFKRTQSVKAVSRLLFPRYSQLDPIWEFELGQERQYCGLVSTKAVIDFYSSLTGKESPSMAKLIAANKQANDPKLNGISHAVEVNMLKNQGLVSWRRNWTAPSNDTQWFVEHEGYNAEQLTAINTQQRNEEKFDSLQERELASISESLESRNPVIASVKPGFSSNRGDHQVVLLERIETKEGDSFIIMDPVDAPGSPHRTETTARFFNYFNDRAIFAKL